MTVLGQTDMGTYFQDKQFMGGSVYLSARKFGISVTIETAC